MLINLSNHPSSSWSDKQLSAAHDLYEEITDIPFPPISADSSRDRIMCIADGLVEKILCMKPDAVMCQGEFTLTYAVVSRLKQRGIKVISACSDRVAEELILPDGTIEKTAIFDFVQFREY